MKTSEELDQMAEALTVTQRSVATNVNGIVKQVSPLGNIQPGKRLSNLRNTWTMITAVIDLVKKFRKAKKQQDTKN